MSNNANASVNNGQNAGAMSAGQPNPFSNIGTPSFNISQLPAALLQNLNPQQLQLIQQKHQQLLRSRLQQQQQQQQQQHQLQQQKLHQQMQQQQKVSQQGFQPSQQQQQQMMLGQDGKKNFNDVQSSTNMGIQSGNLQRNNGEPKNVMTGTDNAAMPFNLPPQIAQMPLQMQQQVLNTLKQKAIQKNNPSVVAAVTMAQQQIQQQLKMQQNVPAQQPNIQFQPTPSQYYAQRTNVASNHGSPQMGVVGNNTFKPVETPAVGTDMMPNTNNASFAGEPPVQKFTLPEFQTINYNPPSTILPQPNYWSSKDPSTDILMYEQVINRDKNNKIDRNKQLNGSEPFSIFGFSNKEYMGKLLHDLKCYQSVKDTQMTTITNTAQNKPTACIWGNGYSGYGNGITNTITNIIPGMNTDNRPSSDQNMLQMYQQVMKEESQDLVPIRLEFDQERDKFSLRDTFLWNRNESLISIEDFVDDLLRDYKFEPNLRAQIMDTVVQSIKEQLFDFQSNPYQKIRSKKFGGDDLRIKIKLDVIIGQTQLVDHIEWDISNPENNPEEFAESMCSEMELPGEFITAIAHSIREQVHMYHKSLVILGHKFDGSNVEDADIRSRMLPIITLDNIYRAPSDSKIYTPNLFQISAAELERLDKDKERDSRRKRRQGRFNRRGLPTSGPNASATPSNQSTASGGNYNANNASAGPSLSEVLLPDISDIPRTFRTPVPSTTLPGGIDLGPSVESYELRTTTEITRRPDRPKPAMPACYVVDNIPGKSLLISITLPKKKSQALQPILQNQTPQHTAPTQSPATFVPIKKDSASLPL